MLRPHKKKPILVNYNMVSFLNKCRKESDFYSVAQNKVFHLYSCRNCELVRGIILE